MSDVGVGALPLAAVAAAVLVAIALLRRLLRAWRLASAGPVHRLFALDPAEYALLGTDLGDAKRPRHLSADGVSGTPDAVFRHRVSGEVVVGEYKSRRGRRPRLRETYQLQLYLGMARASAGHGGVRGLLRFREDLVEVAFDPPLYRALVGLREEVLEARRRGRPVDSRPLAARLG